MRCTHHIPSLAKVFRAADDVEVEQAPGEVVKEVDEDLNEEDDEAEEEDALADGATARPTSAEASTAERPIVWLETGATVTNGLTFYRLSN